MLAQTIRRAAVSSRTFASSTSVLQKNAKFLLPDEYIKKQQEERAQEKEFLDAALNKEHKFQPQIKTDNGKVPLNVEMLQYEPIRLPQTHGHEVVRMKLRGYKEELLIRAADFALRAAFYLGIPCSALKKLKTDRRLYTVIRAPFIHAKSKQNFHRITYNYELAAYDANPEVVEMWLSYINKYNLEDVEYNAKITTHELLDFAKQLDSLTAKEMKLPDAYNDTTDPVAEQVKKILNSDSFKI